MRRIAAPVAFLAAMLFLMAPVSAQTVSSLTVEVVNSAGPITNCPYNINFLAKISLSWPPGTSANQVFGQTLQYKWINSSGIDEPTQTTPLTTGLGLGVGLVQNMVLKNSWQVGAGSYWEALQISFPMNLTSPQRVYVVTCPIPGALTLPSAITGPIISPQIRRP
jgi:hypothetical protein